VESREGVDIRGHSVSGAKRARWRARCKPSRGRGFYLVEVWMQKEIISGCYSGLPKVSEHLADFFSATRFLLQHHPEYSPK